MYSLARNAGTAPIVNAHDVEIVAKASGESRTLRVGPAEAYQAVAGERATPQHSGRCVAPSLLRLIGA